MSTVWTRRRRERWIDWYPWGTNSIVRTLMIWRTQVIWAAWLLSTRSLIWSTWQTWSANPKLHNARPTLGPKSKVYPSESSSILEILPRKTRYACLRQFSLPQRTSVSTRRAAHSHVRPSCQALCIPSSCLSTCSPATLAPSSSGRITKRSRRSWIARRWEFTMRRTYLSCVRQRMQLISWRNISLVIYHRATEAITLQMSIPVKMRLKMRTAFASTQ